MKTSNSHPQPHHTQHRRHRRRRVHHTAAYLPAILPALALATALALSGCSTPNDPPTTASSPATASATTTAQTTPNAPTTAPSPAYKPATANGPAQNVPVPVLPAKAKEFSKAGLEAFATYWYSTLGYAFETGDATPMMAISDPACKPCLAMQKGTAGGHANGKWIRGGKIHVISADSPFAQVEDGTYQVINMVRQDHVQYYKSDKSVSKDLGVTVAIADILVGKYKNGGWTAITVEHLQGSKK